MFIADADQIRELLGDAEPLTDNHPKRLSNELQTPRKARIEYRPWMNVAFTRERFENSRFISAAWPPALRARTLDYFDVQNRINDVGMNAQFSLRDWIARLHETLTTTDLETLVIWQLGETSDVQAAVSRLIARGAPPGRYRESLARRAFAERDYERAARLLAGGPRESVRNPTAFHLRLYALAMAGRVDEAEAQARAAHAVRPVDANGREYYRWLEETFGFEPPSGPPSRGPRA
jgi:hypothetical protein